MRILTQLKRETKYIQNYGGLSTKLYNNIFLRKLTSFRVNFIKKCKNNANEAQFLPLEVKTNIKRMSAEQGLYAQVVMLFRKDLKSTEANKNKNESKFKFQGQSSRSQRWFDIDLDWIEVNFSTREPEFNRKFFQRHEDKQDTNTFQIFQAPIVNSKCAKKNKFHSDASMLKYRQKSLNSCFFSSLASAFASIEKTKDNNDI